MRYEDLQYLLVPLPEPIEKEKWSGHFDNARKRIERYLKNPQTDEALRIRLELEKSILKNLEERYSVDEQSAVEILKKDIPDITAEKLEELRMEDKVDWIYLNGELRYLDSFAGTLRNVYPEICGLEKDEDKENLTNLYFRSKKDKDLTTAYIHLSQDLMLKPAACREDETISVHMPIPTERDGISNFNLIGSSHVPLSAALRQGDEAQPTIHFEEKVVKNDIFSLEYELEYTVQYRDPVRLMEEADKAYMPQLESLADTDGELYEVLKAELQEEAPHIIFSPYLKSLAAQIKGEENNPLRIARKIYDYVTTTTEYRFVRDYASIDSIAEYCALNHRGDCGVMALLFITLCRIAGIPAQWQSGLAAEPNHVGPHDWATFYIPGIGRLYADLSGGSAAYRMRDTDRWNFFFGNVDPYRIPINNHFQRDFEPKKKYPRIDPYDNQCGEIEYEDGGVYGDDLEYSFTPIEIYLK